MCDLDTNNSYGMRVHAEMQARAAKSFGKWDAFYGKGALSRPKSGVELINLGTFERRVNTAQSLEWQLQQLKSARMRKEVGLSVARPEPIRHQPLRRSPGPQSTWRRAGGIHRSRRGPTRGAAGRSTEPPTI